MLFILVVGRTLGPSEFGIVTLALIPFQIATTLGTRTFSQALIQNKEWMEKLGQDIWRASVISGVAVFLIIALCGAAFGYSTGSLNHFIIIALMGLSAPISSLAVIPQAILSREMNFSAISLIETFSSALAVIAGLCHLYLVGDIYAIVVYALTQRITETVLISFTTRKLYATVTQPLLASGKVNDLAMKPVIRFTTPLFGMNLLTAFIQSIDQIFVGLVIGAEALGLYGMARRITEQPARLIVQALERAIFPAAVHALNDQDNQTLIYEKAIVIICLVSGACFFILAATAPLIVPLLLGEHWRPAILFVQIFAIQSAVLPVGAVFLSFITAAGATGKQFAFTITRFTTLLISTVLCAWLFEWSAVQLAIATTVANIALVYPNMILAEKTAQVSSRVGARAMLRGLTPGLAAGLLAYGIGHTNAAPIPKLALALTASLIALALVGILMLKSIRRR